MYCENCGNKLNVGHKFCTKCGHSNAGGISKNAVVNHASPKEDKWWHRLSKVVYIALYLPLLGIIPLVWSENAASSYYDYYTKKTIYHGSDGEAFWYSFLTLVIYMIVLRFIKITFQYIVSAKKPQWGEEFKRLY